MQSIQTSIDTAFLLTFLAVASATETLPAIRVKSEDPAIEVKAFAAEAKQTGTDSHDVAFRFSITNTTNDITKNGQLLYKVFDKDGFELVDPGHFFEARTTIVPGEEKKFVDTEGFSEGEWKKIHTIEFYWKSLKFLDK